MASVTIKGVSYELGDIAFKDENVELFERLMSFDSVDAESATGIMGGGFLTGFRRVLKESLVNGCGPEKAEEALNNLTFSVKSDSDLMRALSALTGVIG